jgi:predicted MFS family arabinose efflux permease
MTRPAATALQPRPRPSPRLPATVWAASAVSFLASSADNFLLFLLLWVAGPQGWSGTQVALIVLVLRLPVLASGVLAGRAVDRWGIRRPMLTDLVARAFLLLLLAACGHAGPLPLLPVLVLGGLSGTVSPATYAGVRTLIPRLVPDAQLGRANAVLALGDQLPLLGGAVLVGPAVALLGSSAALLVAVAMLLTAAVLARTLPGTSASAVMSPGRPPRPARQRGKWSPRVLAVISLSTAYYFAYGPFETASPAFIRTQLGAGEGTYSLLWTLFGAGALVALPLAPLLARRRPGAANALGATAWGLAMLPVAVLRQVPPAAALFLFGGVIWGPYSSIETSALQRWTDPSRHGTIFGLQRSLLASATPVGAAIGAIALEHVSPAVVLAVSAAGCGLAGLLALTSRDLRRAQ